MELKDYKCPKCGDKNLRIGEWELGWMIYDYHVICDSCNFYCPEGSGDYGEAFCEFVSWIQDQEPQPIKYKGRDYYQYTLPDEYTIPDFYYILLVWKDHSWSYYLYTEDEIEEAMNRMKVLGIQGETIYLASYYKEIDNTYKIQKEFEFDGNKIICPMYREHQLHYKFYCDSGEWLNPRKLEN